MFEDKYVNRSGVTLKEVAKITGYSVSTVSKALNDSPEISTKTRQKIVEICNQLGYTPNKTALSLRSGKNFVIAVVLPSIEDSFYARVFHGIQHEIINTNYSIITCITRESLEKEAHVIQKVFNQVDAFIIATAQETLDTSNTEHLKFITKSRKPLVLIDRDVPNFHSSKVISDHTTMVKNITTKIIEKGCKNLVVVSSLYNDIRNLKVNGILEASKKIKTNQVKIGFVEPSVDIDKKLTDVISNQSIDCIIALDENASFSAIRVAKKLNKNIPANIEIVGYMSEEVANNLDVPLTTINQHRKTMGITAITLILENLEDSKNEKKEPQEIKIQSTIVQRT